MVFVFFAGRLTNSALVLQLVTFHLQTLPGSYVHKSLVPTQLDPESFTKEVETGAQANGTSHRPPFCYRNLGTASFKTVRFKASYVPVKKQRMIKRQTRRQFCLLHGRDGFIICISSKTTKASNQLTKLVRLYATPMNPIGLRIQQYPSVSVLGFAVTVHVTTVALL